MNQMQQHLRPASWLTRVKKLALVLMGQIVPLKRTPLVTAQEVFWMVQTEPRKVRQLGVPARANASNV